MRESVTYQMIREEGREEGREMGREEGELHHARRILIRLGAPRFGSPDAAIRSQIEQIQRLDVLDNMLDRIMQASSWYDLIAGAPER